MIRLVIRLMKERLLRETKEPDDEALDEGDDEDEGSIREADSLKCLKCQLGQPH